MNKTQLEYAARRLENIYGDKRAAISQANQKKAPTFNGRAFIAAIKSGKLKLNPSYADKAVKHGSDLDYIFSNFDDFAGNRWNKPLPTKLYEALDKEYLALKDQLWLGDAKEALALIEAFAVKKF
jgi:hypothetical protein